MRWLVVPVVAILVALTGGIPQKEEEGSGSKSMDSTKEKRDWAVAALVLILGGSFVARRIGR